MTPKSGVAKVTWPTFEAMGQIPEFHRTYFLFMDKMCTRHLYLPGKTWNLINEEYSCSRIVYSEYILVLGRLLRWNQQQQHCSESNDGRSPTIDGLHERMPDFANVAGRSSGCRPWWTPHACDGLHRLYAWPSGQPETALTFGVQVNSIDVRPEEQHAALTSSSGHLKILLD